MPPRTSTSEILWAVLNRQVLHHVGQGITHEALPYYSPWKLALQDMPEVAFGG